MYVLIFLLGALVGGLLGVFVTALINASHYDHISQEKEDQLQIDYLKEYNKKHNKNITKTGS